ncbi:MAG: N-6 DNA methylase [Vicinamibacterales bacterium]
MIPGISGPLLSHDALERVIPETLQGQLGEAGRDAAMRRFRHWHRPVMARLGPSASARTVFDHLAGPLVDHLGYQPASLSSSGPCYRALLQAGGKTTAVLLVTTWGEDLSGLWREMVRHGIAWAARWCLSVSGPVLRVTDSQRTYARRFADIDLQSAAEHDASFAVLWGLLRADALQGPLPSILDRAVALSDQHRVTVRNSLQQGVEEALTRLTRAFITAQARRRRATSRPTPIGACTDESLVIIYRILFLLFAEARGLVPKWHPVFRDGYTIEALRADVERLPRPTGIWEAIQAISRLAHHGCRAGSLRVPAFNGRLFSPTHAPLADILPLDDGAVREAVLALTTCPARKGASGRERISYGDLGVEQLGGVYERLLDFTLPEDLIGASRASGRRKATGSFYTPRALTEAVVRRTLAPLVSGASPDAILSLRIVDPAMGSGAFLVAACRYLAHAYELALIRDGTATATDLSDADRAGFRRAVAQRCLYGVDLNPMAVQLGRLSIWLATLAADRPLTFLDHRLRTGDSLVGAAPWDILRQPAPGNRTRRRSNPLPLFEDDDVDRDVGAAVSVRGDLALGPGDTLEQVRAKERALARLEQDDSGVHRWKRVADAWCAVWFQADAARAQSRTSFPEVMASIFQRPTVLPARTLERLRAGTEAAALTHRFFHWPLEFPEIFHDGDGRALEAPGFDAVLGNPPWEMLRGDHGSARTRSDARIAGSRVADFVRGSGIYRLQGDGHVNLYQLFVERALALLRPGARLGLILPSGFAIDHGCAALRRAVFERTEVDTLHGFENRDGLFPIHRGLKFLLATATVATPTTTVPARFGLRRAETLDELPDTGVDPQSVPLSRALLEKISGSQLVVPEIRSRMDLEIVSGIAFRARPLADSDGWHVTFGRELNATDDKGHFVTGGTGLPVIDGKHIQPFIADSTQSTVRLPARIAERLTGVRDARHRSRLAYRDVASSTNRLTLIAAIVPAGVVTTHTLFCSREALDDDQLLFLCGMFNSFVANYLVRLQVSTHVTVSLVSRLPMPQPARTSAEFHSIVTGASALQSGSADPALRASLQAAAARLYGLTRPQLAHVLDTFPLIDSGERRAVLDRFI